MDDDHTICYHSKLIQSKEFSHSDLIEFQPGYNPYVLKTLRTSCIPKQDASDRSPLSDYPCVISKVQTIMLDAVVRFIPSFAWTALSGFQSTGIPFFAQAALVGFSTCRVYIFFLFIPNFCPNLFHFYLVRRDAHFCLDYFILFVQRVSLYEVFLTASAFTGDGKSSSSVVVDNKAPPEKTFLTTNGPS